MKAHLGPKTHPPGRQLVYPFLMTPRESVPLLLLFLATASWAAPTRDDRSPDPKNSVQRWQAETGDPVDFKDLADGSLKRQGGPADPVAAQPRRAAPTTILPRRQDVRTRRRGEVPAAAFGFTPEPLSERALGFAWPSLALLGAGALLLAWHGGPAAPGSTPLEPSALTKAPRIPAPKTTFWEPVAPAPSVEEFDKAHPEPQARPERYVRMPTPSWKAITWEEQQLIDEWDHSQEKALGRASLEEWLDGRDSAATVDIRRLTAKIHRDA